ncbi:MAG: N-acetylglucosamine-6-phosphate deacetylase [Verrucomicrobia bacterium]|nr:N-acetylglucosamine-6-phosphate deacetylase [Verrucomicrobiota bacterium]
MNSPERALAGRWFATGAPILLRWQGERILALNPAPVAKLPELWLAPALFDPQINGFAGTDFQRDDSDPAELEQAANRLAAKGCARFFLTLVTDDWPRMLERLRRLRFLRQGSPILRRAVAGWHIEGPFLSDKPGFAGAHQASAMIDPSPARVRELRRAAGKDRLLLTLAPERKGALESIAEARRLGIRVSLGHTDASAERIEAAIRAGAEGFTHLGNGCPPRLDRRDNILWRALALRRSLRVSLIPDGIHVAPRLFRLLHELSPPARLFYTTDAMAGADAPPGRYSLGFLETVVGRDGIARLPGTEQFAGSTLAPIDGVFRAARMLGVGWQSCWARMSREAAAWLGVETNLAPGARADFCALRFRPDGSLRQLRVFRAGEEVQ